MKSWQKIVIPTVLTLAVGGAYLAYVFHQRRNPGVVADQNATRRLSSDDLAVVRELFPAHFDDLQKIVNTTVWMKNGYTIAYFPYKDGHVDFAKPVGLVPSLQRLDIKKFVKAAVPARVDDGIGHGQQQVFAVFAMPGQAALFALPVGATDGVEEQYYTDLLFFYDDPHGIYDNWTKATWDAIDAHQVKPGMSELQVRLAIGQKIQSSSQEEGNRTVTYNQDGKQWTVTFVNNHATSIQSS